MQKRFSQLKQLWLFTCGDQGLRPIGKISDLLIEDNTWNVRYLVVATTSPLVRQVIIAPAAIAAVDYESKSSVTKLTADEVLGSPPLCDNQPVSQQYEEALVDYYGWPIYWLGRAILKPQAMASGDLTESIEERHSQSNLRSANEICGYQVLSKSRSLGHLADLVVHVDSWVVDIAITDASGSESDLIATSQITNVDWSMRKVDVVESVAEKRLHCGRRELAATRR